MTLAVITAAIVALCTPLWLGSLMRRLAPQDRVRAHVVALALGALLIELGVSAFAARALSEARLGGSASLRQCLLGSGTPAHSLLGGLAAVAAFVVPTLIYRGWRRAGTSSENLRVDPFLGAHQVRDGIDFVRLPTADLVAYSIDGHRPQVVISDGLVDLLSPSELDAVLGHETAHLQQHDGRILRLLAAVEDPVPALVRITSPLRIAVERRADEIATRQDPARREALLDALLKVGASEAPLSIAAFTRKSCVLERAEALLVAPVMPGPFQRATDTLVVGAAAIGGVALVCSAALTLRALLCAFGVCCL